MNRIHLRLLGQILTAEGVIAVLLAALIALVVVAQLRRGPTLPDADPSCTPRLPRPGHHTSHGVSEVVGYRGQWSHFCFRRTYRPILIGMAVSEPRAHRRIFVTPIFANLR